MQIPNTCMYEEHSFFERERGDVLLHGWGDGKDLGGGFEGGEKHGQNTLYEKN